MKKFLSVLIALAIVFSLTVPAMATEESYGKFSLLSLQRMRRKFAMNI